MKVEFSKCYISIVERLREKSFDTILLKFFLQMQRTNWAAVMVVAEFDTGCAIDVWSISLIKQID